MMPFGLPVVRVGVAALAAAAFLGTAPVSAQSGTKVGTLSCDVSAGVGVVLMQRQALSCVFLPDGGGVPDHYVGRIVEYGVALGAVTGGHLVWGVIASTRGVPRGALAGTYAGAGAEATAGVGVGVNVLVGGTRRAFSLQPISLEGQTGVNIAAGLTTVTLAAVP
jgi:hypothetical protein